MDKEQALSRWANVEKFTEAFTVGNLSEGMVDEFVDAIVFRVLQSNGNISDEEVYGIVKWFNKVATEAILVQCVMKKLLEVSWSDKENEPVFKITQLGKDEMHRIENNMGDDFVNQMKSMI
jgi:predicted transcriptional regulator